MHSICAIHTIHEICVMCEICQIGLRLRSNICICLIYATYAIYAIWYNVWNLCNYYCCAMLTICALSAIYAFCAMYSMYIICTSCAVYGIVQYIGRKPYFTVHLRNVISLSWFQRRADAYLKYFTHLSQTILHANCCEPFLLIMCRISNTISFSLLLP